MYIQKRHGCFEAILNNFLTGLLESPNVKIRTFFIFLITQMLYHITVSITVFFAEKTE